jgi:hypothetical protein
MAVSPQLGNTDNKQTSFVWGSSNKNDKGIINGEQFNTFNNLIATAILPGRVSDKAERVQIHLTGLTLITVSTHRETFPVVSSGYRNIKGYTVGHRMVAGSLGFLVLNDDPFTTLIQAYCTYLGNAFYYETIQPDELPPFDILLVFQNPSSELENTTLVIKGVKIIDSSGTTSTDDITPTKMYSYMAMSVNRLINSNNMVVKEYLKTPEVFESQKNSSSGSILTLPSFLIDILNQSIPGFTLTASGINNLGFRTNNTPIIGNLDAVDSYTNINSNKPQAYNVTKPTVGGNGDIRTAAASTREF